MSTNEYLSPKTTDLLIVLLYNAAKEPVNCACVGENFLHAVLTDLIYSKAGDFLSIQYIGGAKDCPYPALRKGKPIPLTEELIAIAANPGKAGLEGYELVLRDRKGLAAFVASYLAAYEAGLCYELGSNYLSYKTSMGSIESFFGSSYLRFGATFNVTAKLEEADFQHQFTTASAFEDVWALQAEAIKRLRLGELLLSLAHKQYITILDAAYDESKGFLLSTLVRFERSPQEIADIEGYWLAYGGLRVNEVDGVAFYKNKRYPFATNRTLEFRLLCHLLKNHGKKLDIIETYNTIAGGEEDFGSAKETSQRKKARIKDYIKNLRSHLGIATDKTPSVDLMLTGETVLLIATPPVRA